VLESSGVEEREVVPDEPAVLAIRSGPGGTCSAAGSALDLLFGASVVATAVLAAVLASAGREEKAPAAEREPAPERGNGEE
jgi:hypothetical protein